MKSSITKSSGILVTITLLFFISFAQTAPESDKLTALRDKCLGSAGVDNARVANARKGIYTEDAAISAYFHCMFTNYGVINDRGEMNTDVLVKIFPFKGEEAKIRTSVDICVKENKHKVEDTAYALYICFVQHFGSLNIA